MSPKIKMSDIHDDRDDDIIELTEDELKEILADEGFDTDDETAPIPEYYSLILTHTPRSSLATTMRPREIFLSMKRATSL